MTVLDQLASSLNRRDEVPNQELAQRIAAANNKGAVKELVDNLHNKNKEIPGDCIKVLYEIGAVRPDLIAGYYKEFGELLQSKTNRLVWGAMTALDSIALKEPKHVHALLPRILAAADAGSVITKDHAVGILAKLATVKAYRDDCISLLLEELMKSPNNQFPMYVETALPVIGEQARQRFQAIIMKRLPELERESAKKRVMKVLKKMASKTVS
jgi:hypothetical protein